MGAVWMRARSEIRVRWRALVVLGVLAGVLGGAAAAAAAGARRTWSAYPRFLQRYGEMDASLSTAGHPETRRIFDEISRLPQVVETQETALFEGASVTAGNRTYKFPEVFIVAPTVAPSRPNTAVKVISGRLPRWEAVDEAVVTYALAERVGLDPGMTITITLDPLEGGTPGAMTRVRVTGVIAMTGSFETLTGRGFASVVGVTPAFLHRHQAHAPLSEGFLDVALRHDERDLPAFQAEIERRKLPLDGPPVPTSYYTVDVQELNRVPVVSLWTACAILGLAALTILGQGVVRETLSGAHDRSLLWALGMDRRALAGVLFLRMLVTAGSGALVAVVSAIAISPAMPLGVARIAEPDPGLNADWLVVVLGAAVTFAGVLAAAAIPAWRSARRAAFGRDAAVGVRWSRTADSLSRTGAPASLVTGVRMALAPGRSASSAPTRTAALAGAFAAAAVVTAFVFAASFNRLATEPRLTGFSWDAAVIADPGHLEEVRRTLPSAIVARSWLGTVFPLVRVEGLRLFAYASDGPPPSILDGRAPANPGEVALDPLTLARLGKRLGDDVSVSSDDRLGLAATGRKRIVGSWIVPRIAFQESENARQAIAFTPDGLASVQPFEFEAVYVRLAPNTGLLEGVDRLREATASSAFAVLSAEQVGAVNNMKRISAVPWLLAALLGLIAAATTAHSLAATVMRRRRDLAVLKTIGFVSRQVRATVAWQATAVAVAAAAGGLPAGLALGRVVWRVFAEAIIVVPEPVAPVAGVLLVAPAAIVFANLIAALPARAAARTRAAVVLRTE